MNIKKILSLTLAGVMIVGLCAISPAQNTQAAVKKATVDFTYPDGAFNDELMAATVVYSDSYFTRKSTTRQDALALLSMGASAAVYNKDCVKDYLTQCGFSDKRYTVSDASFNNLTFDIGKKKVGKKTVVAVILEGTSTKDEWKSNINLGTGNLHEGFNATEKLVHKKLNSYITNNKLKKNNTLFWVTGHSRGAAVADIMAKRLSDKYGKKNVYAYTFAAPKVTKSREKTTSAYKNIFNYVNPDDLVTTVPPENSDDLVKTLQTLGIVDSDAQLPAVLKNTYIEFGTYRRYGTDIIMSISDHESMAQTFSEITGVDFDETSVEHNHCQSCYLSWVMG